MKKILLTLAQSLTLFSYVPCLIHAQDRIGYEDSFKFEAYYIGDQVNNLSGGIKTGSCYLGMANIRLTLDAEKAGLWKGGQFYINAANTHGASPSSELLGDMQVASNIDAGDHTYLQEVWYKQTLGRVELTMGLQDLNVEFAHSEHGAFFLNSSFGILPVISNNIAAPIFPLTALGFTVKWNISEKNSWINALYDGSPTDFDYNPYNVKWQFISGDGLLAISEYQLNTDMKKLHGTYKLGVYSHSHIVEKSLDKNIPDSLNNSLFGVYMYADQKIWKQNNKSIGMFLQVGYCPSAASINNVYFGLGVNFTNPFSKQGKDILGIAIAHEHLKNKNGSETSIEVTYNYQLTKNIFIQPDFQYIINPAGTSETLDNCIAADIRFGFRF
jgi:porin